MYLLGLDIGGTKCAAITAEWDGSTVRIEGRVAIPTDHTVSGRVMAERLFALADELLTKKPSAVGISCGGPLDALRGVVLSPPNLPTWHKLPIVAMAEEHFGVTAHLENDANASALAEWRFGAGRGYENLVFLTFGTGLGAGLILDGRLYRGTNGNAGEVGHVRLRQDGPLGFGKHGSFEGFCSGGGIARLAAEVAREYRARGLCPTYCREGDSEKEITARAVAEAARAGDEAAAQVFSVVGERLGEGLAILSDILNPEAVVIGSIYTRCEDLLAEGARASLMREALSETADGMQILPAALGEEIGDYAAIAAALP